MTTVCLAANTVRDGNGGGFVWTYLNWALGLRSLGCEVIWLEHVLPEDHLGRLVPLLEARLRPYGLDRIALVMEDGSPVRHRAAAGHLDLAAAAAEADLLLNVSYQLSPAVVGRFSRTALLDIDPGLCQLWWSKGWFELAQHDVYVTTGETVGTPAALFPDCGVEWHHVPPSVALDWWTPAGAEPTRGFTTVSNWSTFEEWMEDDEGAYYSNDKRDGFLPYLELPSLVDTPLELALPLDEGGVPDELTDRGWLVADADVVARTPDDYQTYIRFSLGEFSCVKPSCVRLQNAWVSDRTICYLATGRPAVVEHTGPSRILPDGEGLLRFATIEGAADRLRTVASDYERQSTLARRLAEEHFDARKNAGRLLEVALAVSAR